jgi:hypothetical protein
MIAVAFEDGRGINQAGDLIFINPELVCGLQQDRNQTTCVHTTSYVWLVKGDIKMVATKLMMPEILDRAGVPLESLDELEKLIEEHFNANASKE